MHSENDSSVQLRNFLVHSHMKTSSAQACEMDMLVQHLFTCVNKVVSKLRTLVHCSPFCCDGLSFDDVTLYFYYSTVPGYVLSLLSVSKPLKKSSLIVTLPIHSSVSPSMHCMCIISWPTHNAQTE